MKTILLKHFLMYLGALFTGSLMLWMLIKSFAKSFAAQGKKPLVYGLVSGVAAGLTAFGATWLTDNLFVLFWLFAAVFLAHGIVQVALMHEHFYKTKEDNFGKLFAGELLFGLCVVLFTILVFSAAEYFLKDKAFMFYPTLMSALFFFVPILFYHAFRAVLDIPVARFPTWIYPVGRPMDPPDEVEGERLLVIGFEIAKKQTDGRKTYFRARAPEAIGLGELYYHFINDYNELQSETPIQYIDHQNEPYEWWFRVKPKWYQRQRILHPAQSMTANGIRENSVIICERITNP